jgi:regulatory protein
VARPMPDPLGVAVRALAQRDLSVHELAGRLERRGIAEADRAEVIDRLLRAGYVDDVRFARARAQTLAARGLGDAAIRADLAQRGVEADAVDGALAALEPEAERARREAARFGGGARAARALLRKGFGGEALEDAGLLEDGASC